MVDEPQAVLGERQRNNGGTLAGDQRRASSRTLADMRRELGDGGRLEYRAHRKVGVQRGVDRGDQSHRQQGIPAEVEERVVDPDPLHAEDLRVHTDQDLLDSVGRCPVAGGVLIVGCRQGAGVEFAVDRHRQRRQHHHGRRNHVRRKSLRQRDARVGGIGRPGDVADQTLVAGLVFAGDHHGLLNAVEFGQRRLDLAAFDAVAADLDLFVGATQVPQLAVVAPGDQVTGPIHP